MIFFKYLKLYKLIAYLFVLLVSNSKTRVLELLFLIQARVAKMISWYCYHLRQIKFERLKEIGMVLLG